MVAEDTPNTGIARLKHLSGASHPHAQAPRPIDRPISFEHAGFSRDRDARLVGALRSRIETGVAAHRWRVAALRRVFDDQLSAPPENRQLPRCATQKLEEIQCVTAHTEIRKKSSSAQDSCWRLPV